MTFNDSGILFQPGDDPDGPGHVATWDQLICFAETGELTRVVASRRAAQDRAADLQATGVAVSVVEITPQLAVEFQGRE